MAGYSDDRSMNYQDTVFFKVGYGPVAWPSHEETFTVHLELICDQSPHFRNILKDERGYNMKDQIITISDISPEVFKSVLDWLYFRNRLFISSRGVGCSTNHGIADDDCIGKVGIEKRRDLLKAITPEEDEELEDVIESAYMNWHESSMYAFATKYDFPQLRQDIVDAAWGFFKGGDPMWISEILLLRRLGVSDTAPLFRLLVDALTSESVEGIWSCPKEARLALKLPKEVMSKLWLLQDQGLKDRCTYHEHEQDEASKKGCRNGRQATRKRKLAELGQDSEAG